ncbi:MAG TPA: prolipoprotein diacylglyceryl transferase family protein [Anaerolineae bacterium]
MLETLRIGSLALPAAPLVTIAAFWLALWMTARAGKRLGLDEDAIFNAGFYGATGGLIGARAWYVLEYWSFYQNRLGDIFALNLQTLAPFEGILTGVVIATIYLQRKRVPGAALFDALAPGLATFAAGLSLANFASGAAFGEVADVPWAITLWDARRHPTQLYDFVLSLGALLIALRLVQMGQATGRAFSATLAMLAASRLLTEGFRGDSDLLTGGWRMMQFVWLAVLIAAMIVLAWIDTRRAPTQTPEAEVANESSSGH